jgi:hypothetical protein
MRAVGLAAFTAFIATIAAAVWLGEHVGVVDIGFGLEAPAAVYIVGLAFTFRDVVQRTLGVGCGSAPWRSPTPLASSWTRCCIWPSCSARRSSSPAKWSASSG